MLMGFDGQIGLLGRGLGSEDWANLLFVVVMAVLWLVAGLAKTMSKKKSQQASPELDGLGGQRPQAGESWQQRLARRAEELQRRLEEEAGLRESRKSQPPARKAPVRPAQAPGGTIVIRPGQRGEPVMVYERPAPQAPTQREHHAASQRKVQEAVASAGQDIVAPKLEPAAQEVSEPGLGNLTTLTAEPPQPVRAGVQPKTADKPSASTRGVILDYSDPEALTTAILQYEIFGKPLALRETADQLWDS